MLFIPLCAKAKLFGFVIVSVRTSLLTGLFVKTSCCTFPPPHTNKDLQNLQTNDLVLHLKMHATLKTQLKPSSCSHIRSPEWDHCETVNLYLWTAAVIIKPVLCSYQDFLFAIFSHGTFFFTHCVPFVSTTRLLWWFFQGGHHPYRCLI